MGLLKTGECGDFLIGDLKELWFWLKLELADCMGI